MQMSENSSPSPPSIKDIALDLTLYTLANVNESISFKPQLCQEVPKSKYFFLKKNYIEFTGTSIRKNRCKLYKLPTNVSDDLQILNPSIPDIFKISSNNGSNNNNTHQVYKNRLLTELDYENVKRVETACLFVSYTALNRYVHFETDISMIDNLDDDSSIPTGAKHYHHHHYRHADSQEGIMSSLNKGCVIGFRELGHLVGITPWHFHRVFKILTGLTIREYGHLCVEFIHKNFELIEACHRYVKNLRLQGHAFSCLFQNNNHLSDKELYHLAHNFKVLLYQRAELYPNIFPNNYHISSTNFHNDYPFIVQDEYFIDPSKAKEFKKKKNSNAAVAAAAAATTPEEDEEENKERAITRKKRSKLMNSRMKTINQSSIHHSSSLYYILEFIKADKSIVLTPPQDNKRPSQYKITKKKRNNSTTVLTTSSSPLQNSSPFTSPKQKRNSVTSITKKSHGNNNSFTELDLNLTNLNQLIEDVNNSTSYNNNNSSSIDSRSNSYSSYSYLPSASSTSSLYPYTSSSAALYPPPYSSSYSVLDDLPPPPPTTTLPHPVPLPLSSSSNYQISTANPSTAASATITTGPATSTLNTNLLPSTFYDDSFDYSAIDFNENIFSSNNNNTNNNIEPNIKLFPVTATTTNATLKDDNSSREVYID